MEPSTSLADQLHVAKEALEVTPDPITLETVSVLSWNKISLSVSISANSRELQTSLFWSSQIWLKSFHFFSYLSFTGLENSDVRVETKEDEFNFTVMAHSVQKLNVKANLTLQLTSSKPIQVMCLTSIKTLQNMSFPNLYTVFPLERSFCNWFEISSSCVVEPCVIVVTKKMDDYPSVSINGSLVRATNYSFSDYHILEITNLQNGLHFLNVTNSAGLAVYVFDRDRARLYHVPPLNQNKCSELFKSSSSSVHIGDDKVNSTTYSSVMIPSLSDGDTSNISSSTEKLSSLSGNYSNSLNTTTLPLYNSTQKTPTEESAFQNVTTVSHQNTTNLASLRNVTKPTPMKQAIEIEIGGVAAQSHINQNASNNSHAANGKSPSYNIFFQDVEEDDHSQEYLMAVVLSLCVAIFAVIAVISSFLLMEFISRQKQIRNTKIRPFVSWIKKKDSLNIFVNKNTLISLCVLIHCVIYCDGSDVCTWVSLFLILTYDLHVYVTLYLVCHSW